MHLMSTPSVATYGLLGMLATRSWTAYELTQQMHRSLRFVWPTSTAHLYREQKKLVTLGWATVEVEEVGRRTRQRFAITPAGRHALRGWLATTPEEPHLQVEGVLRAFYADSGSPQDLVRALRATAVSTREMLDELAGIAEEYMAPGGPLEMLEGAVPSGDFHGRPMHPKRLPSVALALDATTRLLHEIQLLATELAEEVTGWPSTADPVLAASARKHLERVRARSTS